MATITDSDGWVPVTRPETTDIALGGNETNFPGKFFRELASRDQYLYETALGGDATSIASAVAFRQLGIAAVTQGRLTLETGVPVSTTDQTAKTTLYYTPYNGDYVALYDTVNTRWDLFQFTERSLSLSGLAADTNFDIFLYDNSGTLTLEAVAWSSSGAGTSARTDAISQLEGIWVKDSDKRRYLGTVRTTATTGQCEDSRQSRLVWNISNQVNRIISLQDSTSNVYSGSFRYYGGTTTNQINLVAGLATEQIINYSAHISGDANIVACGLNSTTPINNTLVGYINAATFSAGAATIATGNVTSCPTGYNYLSLLQKGDGSYGFFGAQVSGLTQC